MERLYSFLAEIYSIILNKRKTETLSCGHEDVFIETLTTYNNVVHWTSKYTPLDIFHGRAHIINQNISQNNEHDYQQRLNDFRNTIYPIIKNNMDDEMKDRKALSNENRNQPETIK